MKTSLLTTICLLLAGTFGALAQSTSPNPNPDMQIVRAPRALPANSSQVITFSEYAVGTTITNQYKQLGVVFGTGAFISTDSSNPTSPVLSGTPRFQGPVTCRFVVPGTDQPVAVKSFTFDAGYFDNFSSTRIEWFNLKGEKLGQKINSILGIERFTIDGGNIASWTISIVADEPAGFAIDNVSFVPTGSSIIFRENNNDKLAGVWGLLGDEIPGFDHVGFQTGNKVYESHPKYPSGTYISKDGKETADVVEKFGVQAQHTSGTFKYDARVGQTSYVSEVEEIPIDEDLASKMSGKIKLVDGYGFIRPDFTSVSTSIQSFAPARQKGRDNTFTCVGLVEWSAEQAGYNAGQGFIPGFFESFVVPGVGEVPLLCPQLLNYSMKSQQLFAGAKQWIQAFFDPVDFIVTDPLGRRLGFAQGISYREIPYAFYPGDGKTEQFLVPQAIPGTYKIKLIGKGVDAFAAIGAKEASESFSGMLAEGQVVEKTLVIKSTAGCLGDVNLDALVDNKDVTALTAKLNQFTDGLGNPGDLNGDGLLSTIDVDLLKKLISVITTPVISINPATPAAVCAGSPVSLTATPASFTATNYQWSSIPAGFAGAGASLTAFTQNAPTVSANTTYTITVTATSSLSSVTASVTVTVNALPTAGLTNSGQLSCGNSVITLTASGGNAYRFSAGASQIVANGNTATATKTGVYSVTVTNAGGCTAVTSTTISGSNDLPPAPTLIASALTTTDMPISVTAVGCAGVINWNVQGGVGVSDGALYKLTTPGKYTLAATCTVSGCTSPAGSLALTINSTGGTFALTAPTYNCASGAITFNTSGGDGSPIEYFAIGITNWSANPNQFVEPGLRTDRKVIELKARQKGVEVSYVFDMPAFCAGGTPAGKLALVAPTYNCTTGAITFNTSGGDGSLIEYFAIGITNWSTSPNQTIDRELRADPKTVELKARQGGVVVSYIFDLPAACPSVPVPPSGKLALLAPTYNCASGAITFNTSGGDGSLIEYFAIGITNWSASPNQFVEPGLRTDRKVMLLKARQKGVEVSYTFDMPAFCAGARLGATEPGTGLQVRVLGNPLEGKAARIVIGGVTGQAVQLILVNTQGQVLYQHTIEQVMADEQVNVPTQPGQGLLLLQVSTNRERQQIKLLKQ